MKLQVLSLFLLVNFVAVCEETKLPTAAQDDSAVDKSNMPKTLNTLGPDDSGNWVLKRVWWEKAEKSFGKAMEYNSQISEQQMDYFGARNDIDKKLDEEKRKLGLTLADISKVVTYLQSMISDDDKIADLDEHEETTFKGTILANKDKLKALQDDITALAKLDGDMDNVIVKVIDQTHKCNDYESRAWEDFKQIGRVLSDEKAKELYYEVENYSKNIKSLLVYLQKDLKVSFDSLMGQAENKILNIQKTVLNLKDARINLSYELRAMTEGLAEDPDVDDDEPVAPKKKTKGIWGAIVASLAAIWKAILWLPKKLLGLFGIKF